MYIRMWTCAWYLWAKNEISVYITSVTYINQVKGHQFLNVDYLPRPCHYHLNFYWICYHKEHKHYREALRYRHLFTPMTMTQVNISGLMQQEKDSFFQNIYLNLKKKVVNLHIWSIALYGAKTWTVRKLTRNTLKVLKCGAAEGRRRSEERIAWEMKKCYTQPRRGGISYM